MNKTEKAARSVPPAENQSHFAETTPPAEEHAPTPPPEEYEQQMLFSELPPRRDDPLSEARKKGTKKAKVKMSVYIPKDIWDKKL